MRSHISTGVSDIGSVLKAELQPNETSGCARPLMAPKVRECSTSAMGAPSAQEYGGDTTGYGENGCADRSKTSEIFSNQSSNMQAPAMQNECITTMRFLSFSMMPYGVTVPVLDLVDL